MNLKYKARLFVVLTMIFFLITSVYCTDSENITDLEDIEEQSIVDKFGQLSIEGKNLLDQNGEIVILRGMSLFWSQWGGDFYNYESIEWLRDDWKCTVIRAAMGVESGGYLVNPDLEYSKIKTVIDACIDLGIYVIIDWHDHNGEDHLESAKVFFNRISAEYGNYPNIIYEIYNEPLDVSWSNVIKPYAEEIVSTIRKNDPANIIIVGTPNWSQDVEDVIGNKIEDENTSYSLHFYTGSHKEWLRTKAKQAIIGGIPLFISEWGLSEASGDGEINIAATNDWVDFLEQYNLSWCNWSVTNKDETSAILLPNTESLSGWTESELSEAGIIIKDYLVRMNTPIFDSLLK